MPLLTIYAAFITIVFIAMLIFDISGYAKREKKRVFKPWYPKALVILPVKGIDIEMRKNLEAVKNQNYKGSFDIVAVVDDQKDSAVKAIEEAGIKYIISDVRCNKCSGKVKAIATALRRFRGYRVYVVLDSDVLVGNRWLVRLVAPLRNRNIGLASTFPIFVPHRNNLWSYAKMVWGLVGIGLMESEITRFGWGGSMAFRNDLVDAEFMELLTNSDYSVSDDICVTKAVKARNMGLEYVGDATPSVPCDESAATFFEWANRQTALTLLGYRRNLIFGLVFYTAEALLLISGIVLAILISPIFLVLLLHTANSMFRSYARTRSRSVLIALLVLLMPFIYIRNLLYAKNMQYIEWRGVRYSIYKS